MDSGRLIALRLSKDGFGTVEQIEQMPSDMVMDALEYANFLNEYEQTAIELNRDTK